MKKIERNYCVFTKSYDLEPLYTFKQFPVFMGCVSEPSVKDHFEDMDWMISPSTGSIQLNPLLPLDFLYAEQHNEVVGSLWNKHHSEFAAFIARYECQSIFEIGAAHGILAKNYKAWVPSRQWTILEPNPLIVEGADVRLIRGYFNEDFRYHEQFDAVVHSHVFEHIYFPLEFMKSLDRFVPVGKKLIFSVPNMQEQLRQFFTNCLNFEHTCFLIEPYLDCLLARSGFKVIEKQYFQDHSIFYAAERTENESDQPFPNLYTQNKALFTAFVEYHNRLIEELKARIVESKEPVYLFGAHVFSQFLLNFGLPSTSLVSILDNGPNKIGKRLYGTTLKVESPQVLRNQGKVNVILKAGAYNSEIKKDIRENINSEVCFWE